MKDDDLKKHIQSTLESPSADFTSSLMKRIEAEESSFATTMKLDSAAEPSIDFTAAVMQNVQRTEAKPANWNIVWVIFLLFSGGSIGAYFLLAGNSDVPENEPLVDLDYAMPELNSVWPYVGITVLAISFLFLLERFLYRNRNAV